MKWVILLLVCFGCSEGSGQKTIYDYVPEAFDLTAYPDGAQECIAMIATYAKRAQECAGASGFGQTDEAVLENAVSVCLDRMGVRPSQERCLDSWANDTCGGIRSACCYTFADPAYPQGHACSVRAACDAERAAGSGLCD